MSNINNYINLVKNIVKANNHSNHTLLNKKEPKFKYNISSNDLISERSKNLIYKMLQREDYNIKPLNKMNKSNFILNNNKDEYTQSDFHLNKTPLNILKNISTFGKGDYFFKAKKNKNITDISKDNNDSISLSKLYKLPTLLKNENNYTIRKLIPYRVKKKETKKESTLNYHPVQNLSIDTSKDKKKLDLSKKMSETMGIINKNDKNININLIGYNKISVKNNLKPIKIIKKLNPASIYQKDNNCKINELKNFMKDRFYADTEIKMKKKLKNTTFSIDNSLKNKIIEINKIGDFWKGVFDYCNPVINLKKYKCSRDMFNKHKIMKKKSKTDNEFQKQNLSENKKNIKYELKTPRLFTINSFADYRRQKKLETKNEFFKKYNNDSLQYYLL